MLEIQPKITHRQIQFTILDLNPKNPVQLIEDLHCTSKNTQQTPETDLLRSLFTIKA